MSWTFQLQQINRSFERIANCREFMHRTEISFQNLHQRVLRLEERQVWVVSDEQLERVLLKMFAEGFSQPDHPRTPPGLGEDDYFVENPKDRPFPRPIHTDAASLFVEPDSVPSREYAETFQMLESRLPGFPRIELGRRSHNDVKDINISTDDRKYRYSNSV